MFTPRHKVSLFTVTLHSKRNSDTRGILVQVVHNGVVEFGLLRT